MAFTRRSFIQAAGTGLGAAALGLPRVVRAQTEPIRIGLVTVKTGPLASGGIDMERALVQFLRERNNTLAGRKVELFVADSAGVPAQARTKLQELVERNRIQVMIGPLAAGEALEAHLAKERETGRFCHGDTPTMADLCLASQVFAAGYFDAPTNSVPTVRRIFDECMKIDAFDRSQPTKQPDAPKSPTH